MTAHQRDQQLVDGLGRRHEQGGGLDRVEPAASGHLGELAEEEHAEAQKRLNRLPDHPGSSGCNPTVFSGGAHCLQHGRPALLWRLRIDEDQQCPCDPTAMIAQRL